MATGLNASVTSFVTETTISSSAMNSNLSALNGATAPSFATVTVDQQTIYTKPLSGSNQTYIQFSPSDGTSWGIGEQVSDGGVYFAHGTVQFEVHPTKGIKPRQEGYFISGMSFLREQRQQSTITIWERPLTACCRCRAPAAHKRWASIHLAPRRCTSRAVAATLLRRSCIT